MTKQAQQHSAEPARAAEQAKHTPEPWELHARTRLDITVEHQGVFIFTPSLESDRNAGLAPGEGEANARRIVACVNFLRDVSTAEIESKAAPYSQVTGWLKEANTERDALRARCERLEAALKLIADGNAPMKNGHTQFTEAQACARTALAESQS